MILKIFRIMALNLLNLYSLIFALFDKIGSMNKEMEKMRINTNILDAAIMQSNWSMLPDNSTETIIPAFLTESSKLLLTTVSNTMAEISRETEAMWNAFVSPSNTVLPPNCREIEISCEKLNYLNKTALTSMAFLTTTVFPEIWSRLNMTPTFDYGSTTPVNTSYDWFTDYSSSPSDWYSTTDFGNFTDDSLSANYTADGDPTTESNMSEKEEDNYDYQEQYKDDDEDYNEAGGQRRRRREVNDIFDEIQRMAWQTTDEYDNQTNTYYSNYTELISSTIASFMENFTMTSDDWNTTTASEMWTDFVTNNMWTDDMNKTRVCYQVVCDEIPEITTLDYTTFGSDEKSVITETATPPSTQYPFSCPPLPTLPPEIIAQVNDSTMKYVGSNLTKFINHMDILQQTHLRKLCWETMFGQELVKLTVMDLVSTHCLSGHNGCHQITI